MRVKGKHVILAFVLLVTGFIISLSYQFANDGTGTDSISQTQWRHEDELRNKIIIEQAVNRNLQEELRGYQAQLSEIEEQIAEMDEQQELRVTNLIEDLERLRKVVGSVKVKGPGVEVKLSDASYIADGGNPNDYIVHENHVQMVVDELLVAGAEAISINGQRITHRSYIRCIGPVILIDGHTSAAPFVVSAIGDTNTLEASLNILGGVKDRLVNDQIEVRIEKKDIIMEPLLAERG
ncbi:DUF881 domain-containing protein [Alkalihalobacillus sp. LMS39]|uniref:DUF881 domain-containing protein n=1 Tax=Alkalihalobacillus sp. LMS39 TaxID=2924032 RepID=UPI001FB4F26F|nr:DUF881 domain-containing protein [Alkalihalobacillus sp. LMS39]UOE92925.1 DUF881 domain-containing protein [Alkalihalobacillus sp. LMS39]